MARTWPTPLPTPNEEGFEEDVRSYITTLRDSAEDLDSEVVTARGGESTLTDRLNAITSGSGNLWTVIGEAVSRTNTNEITISGADYTSVLIANTPIQLTYNDTTTFSAYVVSASFSTNTVVTLTADPSAVLTISSTRYSKLLNAQVPRGAGGANALAISALATTDGGVIIGNGSQFVLETGATLRTSLGLGTGDSPQFSDLGLGISAGSLIGTGRSLVVKSTNAGSAALKLASIEASGFKSGETDVDCAHYEGFNVSTRLGNMVFGQGSASTEGYTKWETLSGGTFAEAMRIDEGRRLRIGGSTLDGGQTTVASTDYLIIGPGSGDGTNRSTIRFTGTGYNSTPSNANANSDGDKLVFFNDSSNKMAIGIGSQADMWLQSNGHANSKISFWTATDGTPLERVIIDSSGNFGIGTTPTEKFHLYSAGTHTMLMHGLDADSTLTYEMQSNSRTAFSVATYLAGGSGNSFGSIISSRGYLQFHTGTSGSFSEAMRIDSSGKVGIGVTPSVQFHVEINDDTNQPVADFRNSAGAGADRDAFIRFRLDTSYYSVGHHAGTNAFIIANASNMDSAQYFRMESTGYIGLSSTIAPTKYLQVGNGTDAFGATENGIGINVAGSAALVLRNSTSDVEARLVVDSGNMDIGTLTAHGYKFRTNDIVRGEINSAGEWSIASNTAPVSGIDLLIGGASGNKKIRLDAGEADGVQIQFYHASAETCFINSNTTDGFSIYKSATQQFGIRNSDGHVGINTSPGSVIGLGQCLTIKTTQTATASLKLAGIEIQGNKSGETNVDCAHFEGFNTTTRLANMVIGQGSSSNEGYIRFEQRIGGGFAEAFRIGEGGKLSTNGETAPDCGRGGITLVVSGTSESDPFSYKNTSASHGITDLAETDTLLQMRSYQGGSTYSSWFRSLGTTNNAHLHQGYCVTNTTANDGGCFTYLAGLKSGTTVTTFASSDTIFAITNNGAGAVAIKGNGDIYTETDQTSGLAGTFDEYDDIELSSIAKLAAGGRVNYDQVSENNRKMLRDLKIMDGTFINHTNMHRLHLGRSDQMWNMIRHAFAFVGEKIGIEISEEQLKSFAKNYEPQLLGA